MIPILPHDKANHFVYGAVVGCVGLFISPLASAVAILVVSFGKEIYDLVTRRGTPDGTDALASMAGGAVVLAPTFVRSLP